MDTKTPQAESAHRPAKFAITPDTRTGEEKLLDPHFVAAAIERGSIAVPAGWIREGDALKSAQAVDVERVMGLVERYASAQSALDESFRSRSRFPRLVNRHDLRVRVEWKAAREALRSALVGKGMK